MSNRTWSSQDGKRYQHFRNNLQQRIRQQETQVKKLQSEVTGKEKQRSSLEKKISSNQEKSKGNSLNPNQAELKRQLKKVEQDLNKVNKELNKVKTQLRDNKKLRQDYSQYIGEKFGHKLASEKGYQTILHDRHKGISQGFDGVYKDSKTGDTVIAEFKGQNSRLTKEQKKISWSADTAEKVLAGKGNYKNASEAERQVARQIQKAHKEGSLRHEVIRTKVKDGQLTTKIEKTTRPKRETAEKHEPEIKKSSAKEQSRYRSDRQRLAKNQARDRYQSINRQKTVQTTTQSNTQKNLEKKH